MALFLACNTIGEGIVNEGDLIAFLDEGDAMEVRLKLNNTFVTDDVPTMDYLRAYGFEHNFYKLGETSYNPINVSHLEVDATVPIAYITDCNGDSYEHTVASEIMALQAAAGAYIWLPTPPAE